MEILLINDGSTDNSEAICREYEHLDSRIRYYYHENMGLARTRNRGIVLASGSYITFLDSDDWLEPDFVKCLLTDMQSHNADIGLCDINYVDDKSGNKNVVKLRFLQSKTSVEQDKSVVNKSRLFAWGKIYRKSLFTSYHIEFPDITYEDICTPLLTIRANTISYTPTALINYLQNRSDSLSNVSKHIGDIGKGLTWLKERLIQEHLYEDYRVEYKKIVLAQLRFATRRFGGLSDTETQENLQALSDIVERLQPDLHGITDRKYYVPKDSPILWFALDKCLPYENQIVSSLSDADTCITIDEEMLKYSMAELIMEIM